MILWKETSAIFHMSHVAMVVGQKAPSLDGSLYREERTYPSSRGNR